jgi:hypothetical protein
MRLAGCKTGAVGCLALTMVVGNSVLSVAQGVHLKAGAFEQHLDTVNGLVYGDQRQTLPPPPWAEAWLKERKMQLEEELVRSALLPQEAGSFESYERICQSNAIILAWHRPPVPLPAPGPPGNRAIAAYFDASVALPQLILHDVVSALETLDRYAAYKRRHVVGLDQARENELKSLLIELEGSLRSRTVVSRVLYLMRYRDNPPPTTSKDILEQRLAEARLFLPETHQRDDAALLSRFRSELDGQIYSRATNLWRVASKTYATFLSEQYASLMEGEKKMHGVGQERRESEASASSCEKR